MSSPLIISSEFDREAFGVPFYRVTDPTGASLEEEIAALRCPPVIIDAKVASNDRAAGHRLILAGFQKICMQITLACKPSDSNASVPADVEIVPVYPMHADILAAHAQNFRYDRFGLDPRISSEGSKRLYEAWLANSLAGRNGKTTAHLGDNVCTFACHGEEIVIDLMSVLDHGKGIGTALMKAIVCFAGEKGMNRVRVTTECENVPAWKLYRKCGFVPVSYTSVFHLVEGAQPY